VKAKSALLTLVLAGCAARPSCQPTVIHETKIETDTINRYVVVRAPESRPAHEILLKDYENVVAEERKAVIGAKNAGGIDRLIPLDQSARLAFVPLETPGHVATSTEITHAILTLGALQAGVDSLRKGQK